MYATGRYLYAIDATSGTLLWRLDVGVQPLTEQPWRPVAIDGIVYLSTRPATDSVNLAHAVAVDGANGTVLWKASLGGQIVNGPMTYEVDGVQYVAAAAGNSLFTFALRR